MNRKTLLWTIAYQFHKGLDSYAIAQQLKISEGTVCDCLAEIRADKNRNGRAA